MSAHTSDPPFPKLPRYVRDRLELFGAGLRFPKRRSAWIFDIDGTMADLSHRLHHVAKLCPQCGGTGKQVLLDPDTLKLPDCEFCHGKGKAQKNYYRFFTTVGEDLPVPVVIEWAQALKKAGDIILVVSGRDLELCGQATEEWLGEHKAPFDYLLMKAPGDNRPDEIVKAEILDAILKTLPLERIAAAVDDRHSVIRMWRSRGVRVYPVRCIDRDFE